MKELIWLSVVFFLFAGGSACAPLRTKPVAWNMRIGVENCKVVQAEDLSWVQMCGEDVQFRDETCKVAGGLPRGADEKGVTHNLIVTVCPVQRGDNAPQDKTSTLPHLSL